MAGENWAIAQAAGFEEGEPKTAADGSHDCYRCERGIPSCEDPAMRLQSVALLLAAVFTAGCSGGGHVRVDSMGFSALGQNDAPDGCGVVDVGRLVVGFLDVFNSGTIGGRVDEFIAPENRFGWFSVEGVGERLNSDASDRATLGAYLQERADAGERLRLVAMATEYELARNVTHLAYNVKRKPETSGIAAVVVGKGAVDCESGRIMAWSMGTSDAGQQTLCRGALSSVDPDLPIVCLRDSHES